MHLSVTEARQLAEGILMRRGYSADDAATIAEVLVEAHLWGRGNSGLQHLKQITEVSGARKPISIVRQDDHSAVLDGGNNAGLLLAPTMVRIAIAKAKAAGIAAVSASNGYLGGIGGYYVNMAAREGLIALMAMSSGYRVAPAGGIDAIFGTNPLSIAFPTAGDPIIYDIATSSINVGGLHRAERLGEELKPGLAIGPDGDPTTDPTAALKGAILPFGGHKGAGLAMVVQLFGLLGGGAVVPRGMGDFGYFVLVMKPSLFMPMEDYERRIGELVDMIHAARPAEAGTPVRVPGERAMALRARCLAEGFEIDDKLYQELSQL
jgi:LDH2 family malate/lactate/ureidoglycolate dehydrogenase